MVEFTSALHAVDWVALKADLIADAFDNGRTPEQLELSFANSQFVILAVEPATGRIVGTARILSDGVCNAYLVDVWTKLGFRKQGIAREMIRLLLKQLPGQHVYLQADDDLLEFYKRLGFEPQPNGMCVVVGTWLKNFT